MKTIVARYYDKTADKWAVEHDKVPKSMSSIQCEIYGFGMLFAESWCPGNPVKIEVYNDSSKLIHQWEGK